jgi:ABC-type Fe3+ transport system permease subunit
MHGKGEDLAFTYGITFNSVRHNFQQYLYGSMTLAVIAALLGGLITWTILALFRKKQGAVA